MNNWATKTETEKNQKKKKTELARHKSFGEFQLEPLPRQLPKFLDGRTIVKAAVAAAAAAVC